MVHDPNYAQVVIPLGVNPVRWSFNFDRVFMRFNVYLKRLKMIESILEATVEILKLEKVEFCGLRGKIISVECMKVLEDYTLIYQNLGNITYDPADPEDNSFLSDYDKHMDVLNQMDRRLASLFSQGLDECHTMLQIFKFFQIIGDLYHRPIIKEEIQPKLNKLMDLMHDNLDCVKEIFDDEMAKLGRGQDRPMVDAYLPPVAGMMWWIHKLRKRVEDPIQELVVVEDPIVQSESATYMRQKANEMLGYLNSVDNKSFTAWCATVPTVCKMHLAKNLIYRDPPFVRNNFSPELEMLLREIRHMMYLNRQGIPQDGLDLYARNEKLQYDLNRLNRAISWYNAIREGSHETEVALIEKEISAIDDLLGRGVEEYTWNDDFTEWMAEVYAAINTLQERVLRAQNNMKEGLKNIAAWGDVPLYSRKENRSRINVKGELLAVSERHPRFVTRAKCTMGSRTSQPGATCLFTAARKTDPGSKSKGNCWLCLRGIRICDQVCAVHPYTMCGLETIAAWGDVHLYSRKENRSRINVKGELLAVSERHPRFVASRKENRSRIKVKGELLAVSERHPRFVARYAQSTLIPCGLENIAAWGDVHLYSRKENRSRINVKGELLAVSERHPRFVASRKEYRSRINVKGELLAVSERHPRFVTSALFIKSL
ncbi:dynein beta chain, ciliary-like [Cydia splendana]|uniref:dynein beta chain, ciliary-like n=1 Tax=Cydia splendana TaxID=1100963 RepID=UPI00300CF627